MGCPAPMLMELGVHASGVMWTETQSEASVNKGGDGSDLTG